LEGSEKVIVGSWVLLGVVGVVGVVGEKTGGTNYCPTTSS
jgi:hypothetical protein